MKARGNDDIIIKAKCYGCEQEKPNCRQFLHEVDRQFKFVPICEGCLKNEENDGRLYRRILKKLRNEIIVLNKVRKNGGRKD